MATTTRTTKAAPRDVSAEVAFLTRALKAPTLRDAVQRLAERARAESWTHEEFLVACLQREVAARESHGGEGRIRAARFPARKSIEEFDFDHARTLKRDTKGGARIKADAQDRFETLIRSQQGILNWAHSVQEGEDIKARTDWYRSRLALLELEVPA